MDLESDIEDDLGLDADEPDTKDERNLSDELGLDDDFGIDDEDTQEDTELNILDKEEVDEIKDLLNEDNDIDDVSESEEQDIKVDEEESIPTQDPIEDTSDYTIKEDLAQVSEKELGAVLGEELDIDDETPSIGGQIGTLSDEELALIDDMSDLDDDDLPPVKSEAEVLAERVAEGESITNITSTLDIEKLAELFSAENLQKLNGATISIKINLDK